MGKLFPAFLLKKRDRLSHGFCFCSCTQDKFVMVLSPRHAHLLAIKIQYTLTVFWLRDSLYPRFRFASAGHGATLRQCPQLKSCTVIAYRLRSNLYPRYSFHSHGAGATLVMLNKICTRTAKSAPYPPCTVTAF
jgi:hypothetical protein